MSETDPKPLEYSSPPTVHRRSRFRAAVYSWLLTGYMVGISIFTAILYVEQQKDPSPTQVLTVVVSPVTIPLAIGFLPLLDAKVVQWWPYQIAVAGYAATFAGVYIILRRPKTPTAHFSGQPIEPSP